MRFYDIIEKKKRNEPLTDEEISFAVKGYTEGEIPDYQMSALLMAICLKGMNDDETLSLTRAIVTSGETVDLGGFGDKVVDKHSSGGVGDKTTLIISPIVASLGGIIAKMSGRSLGHTGGTVDKLEAIDGFKTSLGALEFKKQVTELGIAVVGQSLDLAPADKKIYALRDVTATVDSIPLIASSIMGKKLASGADAIVLDVKYGSGAFMKTKEDAEALAKTMVKIGKGFGRQMAAVISSMEEPLGYAVGNLIEVSESIEVLKGVGDESLRELCITLSTLMTSLSLKIDCDKARSLAEEAVSSGAAYKKFKEWILAQGGCLDGVAEETALHKAKYSSPIIAKEDGYLTKAEAERIGISCMMLGAGRAKKEDPIDPLAGILLKKKVGDKISAGDTLAILFSSSEKKLHDALSYAENSFRIEKEPPITENIIYKIVY